MIVVSVVKMTGVSIVGKSDEIEKISRRLLSKGFFEPMPLEIMLDDKPPKSRISRFRDNPYDAPLEKASRIWKAADLTPPVEVGEKSETYSPSEANALADTLSAKVDEWAAWSERVRDDRAAMQAVIIISEALAESGRTFEEFKSSSNFAFSLGPVLLENWDRMLEVSSASQLMVMPLIKGDRRVLALALYPSDYKNEALKIFDAVHFQEYSGSSVDDSFNSIDGMRTRFKTLDKSSGDIRGAAVRYIEENREMCEKIYLGIFSMQRVYALLQPRGEFSGMFAISGFVPTENIAELKSITEKESPETLFITETDDEILKHSKIPTLLRNNRFVRSFQEIVNLYSIPAYGEFDPSPIVAFTFCLFFGVMFGDVGHGAALAIGAWWLEKRGIMSSAFAKVIKIAGMVSMFFGVLYGSVFGDEAIIPPIWVSPMHDTNNLIVISIFIGIVFLSLGMVLKLLSLYKKGEFGELCFGSEGLAGLLFYLTACITVIRAMSDKPFGGVFVEALLYLVLVGLFILILLENVLTRRYFHHDPHNEGVVHVFSIFHAMLSFVSNTASFVRLAAFAMNHAGLSLAVYMLADMVRATPGGKLTSIIVVLIGNIIIIALEGLIVFIQTLRLEYYEFFSKFFTGGGRPFAPVNWKEN